MIAVSFCNTHRSDSMYILNDQFDIVKTITLNGPATGVVKVDSGFFVVCKGINIYKINNNFEIQNLYKTGLQDIHSLLVDDNHLFIVSTACDTIAKIKILDGNLNSGDPEIVFSKNTGGDNFHINSITKFGKSLLFSNFGECGENKKDAKNGGVESIFGKVHSKGIKHPHSLKSHKDDIYFLESKTSTLYKNGRSQFSLRGYLRGLDIQNEDFLIGSSKSRNTDDSEGTATLIRTNKEGGILDLVEFEDFEEIYDVVSF